MRAMFAGVLLMLGVLGCATAQPVDCPVEPSGGLTLPLSLDLAGRRGVPAGTTGQAFIAVPMQPPGIACGDARPPPMDVLQGEPGSTLGPPMRDLLHGPGTPRVDVESQ